MAKRKHEIIECTIGDFGGQLMGLPAEVSVMAWGRPGEGKTGVINSVFSEAGYRVWPILAGCSDPTDFGGIPDMVTDAPCFDHKPPLWAFVASTIYPEWYKRMRAKAGDAGEDTLFLFEAQWPEPSPLALFFDDVVTADEQTQASLYKATHERRIGQCFFRGEDSEYPVRLIFAGNRTEDKSAAQDMPLALGNRMLHYNVRSDFDEWQTWAVSNRIYPLIVAYLRTQPQDLSSFDEAVKLNVKAFATPRSWELLSKTLKSLEKANKLDPDSRFPTISGLVGEGIAHKLTAYFKNAEGLIPPEEIVKNPEKAKVFGPDQMDIGHATVASLEGYIQQNSTCKNIEAGLTYGMRMIPELGVVLAMTLIKVVLKSKDIDKAEQAKAMQSPVFQKALTEYNRFI